MLLRRVDRETNMDRVWFVCVRRLMFGWGLTVCWGRRGRWIKERVVWVDDPWDAVRLAKWLITKKIKRGYEVVIEKEPFDVGSVKRP